MQHILHFHLYSCNFKLLFVCCFDILCNQFLLLVIDESKSFLIISANYATYARTMHPNYYHGSNIGIFARSPKPVLDAYPSMHSMDDIQVDDSGRYTESNSSNSRFPSQSWDLLQVSITI